MKMLRIWYLTGSVSSYRFNTAFFLACSLSLLLLLCGCSQNTSQAANPAQASTYSKVVTMDASWSHYYPTLASIKKDADLGIRGQITRILSTDAPANAPISTYFIVTIEEVLWNPHNLSLSAGATIILHQEGGVVNGTLYQADDDPLFQIGEQTIVFLRQYSPGHFFVLGGPSGRFKVSGSIVTPISADGMPLPNGTTLSSFRALLLKA
jgi:hypothetical protein